MEFLKPVEEVAEMTVDEIKEALSSQNVANEVEAILRDYNSIPAAALKQMVSANPLGATAIELGNRLAAALATLFPPHTLPPVSASPEKVGRTKVIQAKFDAAAAAPPHYTVLPAVPQPAAKVPVSAPAPAKQPAAPTPPAK
jgi:hypothetical protein